MSSGKARGKAVAFSIGFDIGGTKVAGGLFDAQRMQRDQLVVATPSDYPSLLAECRKIVDLFDARCGERAAVGVGVPGPVDRKAGVVVSAANTPCIAGRSLRDDLRQILERPVQIANDADCAALSEAVDGAGEGHEVVFGLVMGTGVGGGLVVRGKLVQGANGLSGEVGHVPLPFRELADGDVVQCDCGQLGCIDKSVSGPALSRLYASRVGRDADPSTIAERAIQGDARAAVIIDQFTTTVAKAIVPILHMFDPDVITLSGGLSNLQCLFDDVPKKWGCYAMRSTLKTLFLPAKHGALTGLRGAAWVGQDT